MTHGDAGKKPPGLLEKGLCSGKAGRGQEVCSAVHLPAHLGACKPGESEIALPTPLSLQGAGERGGLSKTESREVCLSQIFLMISPHTGQEVKLRSLSRSPPRQLLQGPCVAVGETLCFQSAWMGCCDLAPTLTAATVPTLCSPSRPHVTRAALSKDAQAGLGYGRGTRTRFLTCCHII